MLCPAMCVCLTGHPVLLWFLDMFARMGDDGVEEVQVHGGSGRYAACRPFARAFPGVHEARTS